MNREIERISVQDPDSGRYVELIVYKSAEGKIFALENKLASLVNRVSTTLTNEKA